MLRDRKISSPVVLVEDRPALVEVVLDKGGPYFPLVVVDYQGRHEFRSLNPWGWPASLLRLRFRDKNWKWPRRLRKSMNLGPGRHDD